MVWGRLVLKIYFASSPETSNLHFRQSLVTRVKQIFERLFKSSTKSNHSNRHRIKNSYVYLFYIISEYLPKLLFSCASLHLPTTLIMALPAIRVQCITAGKFGSLLAWFVMSAPNCGGLMLAESLCYELADQYISGLLWFSRDISHSGRNTTLRYFRKNPWIIPRHIVYIPTTAVLAPTRAQSFDITQRMRRSDLRIAVVRIATGGEVTSSAVQGEMRNKTAASTETTILVAKATSPCQQFIPGL